LKSRSNTVIAMVEKQSEIGRDAQLAFLLQHKWHAEIERAVDKVKLGVVPGRKWTKTDKWFRRQLYKATDVFQSRMSSAVFCFVIY